MQNPQMSKALKIGELAQQTGLSIRTLHYYDEIGLLCPSQRTEAGHRLYTDEDISCLQQILSLRQLGFALKEIRDCLANPDFSLPKIVDLHRAKIREEMALSRTLLKQLDAIAAIQLGQTAIHQLNFDIFGTEGILLGLIAQKTSLAAQILQNAGVTFTQAQSEIIGQLGERSTPSIPLPPPDKMPFAYRTMRVLELARQEAAGLPQKRITPECLLWGILQETVEVEAENQPSGVASRVLREGFGVDLMALEQQVKAAISGLSEQS